jgi:ribosomal protein S18 acetylase RimI-like enzyme
MDPFFDREARASETESQRHHEATRRSARPGLGLRWIPIRSLAERHRPRILAHLLALDEFDRYLRFGYAASDAQISRYVDQLDFDRDEVFGIFNRRLELVAMAQLAYLNSSSFPRPAAEFGVSVAKGARGRGYGDRLFDHAALHARNRGIDSLLVHALSENTAMLRICRNAGARIERDGPESQAWVKLAPESLASHVEALVEGTAADLDYRLKLQAHRVDELLSGRPKGSMPDM